MTAIEKRGEFYKVADGIAYGWAVVSTIDGAPYVDTQGDYIPHDTIPAVAAEFMSKSRVGKDMHRGDQVADVLFALPVAPTIAKVRMPPDDPVEKTGLVIGWRPHDKSLLEKIAAGQRIGFSIGGTLEDAEGMEKIAKRDADVVADDDRKPRKWLAWKLEEISLVDFPAQEPALIGVVKRKVLATTRVLAAHKSTHASKRHSVAHMSRTLAKDAASARAAIEAALEMTDDAEMKAKLQVALDELAPADPPKDEPPADKTESTKRQQENPMKIVVLTEAQHAHYAKLHSDDERSAFLAKSDADRHLIIKAAQDSDPIVYTSKATGRAFRKSEESSDAYALTKQIDAQADVLAKRDAEIEKQAVRQIAKARIPHLPGSDEVHDYIVASICKGGGDETMVNAALDALAGGSNAIEDMGQPGGVGGEGDPEPDDDDPEAQLEEKAKAYAKEHKLPFAKAYREVLKTDEGKALYEMAEALKKAS